VVNLDDFEVMDPGAAALADAVTVIASSLLLFSLGDAIAAALNTVRKKC
jgi:hypothetical protein